MAHITAGITATWNGTAFGEITELRWLQGGSLPSFRGRGSTAAALTQSAEPWGMDLGTIEVTHLGSSALGSPGYAGQWGRKAVLAIGGTARDSRQTAVIITVNLTTKAICQTLDLGAKVNDVWRYKSTFKIVKE